VVTSPPAADAQPPGILRRLASMLYESLLLFAVGFAGAWLFFFASGGREVAGWMRYALQAYLAALYAAYFLWCWLRGGQTLAMKTWRIRLVAPGRSRVTPGQALLRLVCAGVLAGAFLAALGAAFKYRDPWLAVAGLALAGVGLGWALVDRDRQFLHDRLAGTRLVLVPPPGRR
jgi:uncharacterized RDD family membrane protein YckC